uniref:Uncharacterized protein n=1 Tax=Globisporangium ultimum (strain ATCC 200006 / CBS 805.95 / DAOM BR144) TaxID=431595 RepID=K3WMJ3_GLOUD
MTQPQRPQPEPLIVYCGTSDPRQSSLSVHVPGTECTEYYVKNSPSRAYFTCKLLVTPSLLWFLTYTLLAYIYALAAACTKSPTTKSKPWGSPS